MVDPPSTARVLPNGVLIVDKPRGPTSHDVVSRVRRIVKSRHVGHAGTLDPMATGVLVVAIGEATKLVPWLTADDKTYEATIRLGVATDSLDADGIVTERVDVPDAVLDALRAPGAPSPLLETALATERARTAQTPPAISAIRIGGERAHALARSGRLEGDLPARPTSVRALDIIARRVDAEAVEIDVRVASAKGYFVRALARDLARSLGTVGHLTALRRVRSGAFTTEDAVSLEVASADRLLTVAAAAARALPVTILDDAGARAVSFGQRVAPQQMTNAKAGPSAWMDAASRLLAVGELEADGSGRVLRGFPQL